MHPDVLAFFAVPIVGIIILFTGIGAPATVVAVLRDIFRPRPVEEGKDRDRSVLAFTAILTIPFFLTLIFVAGEAEWPNIGEDLINSRAIDGGISSYLDFMGTYFSMFASLPAMAYEAISGTTVPTIPLFGYNVSVILVVMAVLAILATAFPFARLGQGVSRLGKNRQDKKHRDRSEAMNKANGRSLPLDYVTARYMRRKAAYPDLITSPDHPDFDRAALDAANAEFDARPEEIALAGQYHARVDATKADWDKAVGMSTKSYSAGPIGAIGRAMQVPGQILEGPAHILRVFAVAGTKSIAILLAVAFLASTFMASGAAALVLVLIPAVIVLGAFAAMAVAAFAAFALFAIVLGGVRRG